ncbi:MAG: hypothetical protein Q9172_005590 [Xanthocarpia lactea]
MSRHISRSLLRHSNIYSHLYRAPQTRRFLTTGTSGQTSRSWKSSAVRWGLAAGIIYYYNTSPYFANEPMLLEPLAHDSSSDEASLPTLDSIAKHRDSISHPTSSTAAPEALLPITDEPTPSPLSDPSATESEAASEGAFNEETGEINWECPCLGGMAHGPCGDQFRTAFSCFVFSKEDPKGMDCIEHFKSMQDCFRQYPEVYGGELEEDEVENEIQGQQAEKEGLGMPLHQSQATAGPSASVSSTTSAAPTTPEGQSTEEGHVVNRKQVDQSEAGKRERAKEATRQVHKDHAPLSESDELVPKASHDATSANDGK